MICWSRLRVMAAMTLLVLTSLIALKISSVATYLVQEFMVVAMMRLVSITVLRGMIG